MYKLSYDNYEEIKKKVVDLYSDLAISYIPIDCFYIAHELGFKVVPYSQLSAKKLDAILKLSGGDAHTLENIDTGEKIIFFNDNCSIGRQRFTIFHEIGHYILDHREISDLAELQADYFAGYAIAPLPLVHVLRVENYLDLAEIFNTSQECAYVIMERYIKWMYYGPEDFTGYEQKLIGLFTVGDNE